MKKRILCLTLALIISGAQVVSVSATREDEAALQQEMDATNEQLNATYSRLDDLSAQKSQIEGEISTLDANLVNVMVSIQTLEPGRESFLLSFYHPFPSTGHIKPKYL